MRRLLLLAATYCLLVAPSALHAEPGGIAGSLGLDNPSGKMRSDGTPLSRLPDHTRPAPQVKSLSPQTQPTPDCPATMRCVFIPAAYQNNNPADPVDYGNYDQADRPKDSKITSIILHDTEGDLQSTLDAFRDPQFFVSAHYVINADGTIYQMVQNKDIAWHAGNWWYNQHSIGIEHVGHAALGSSEFSQPCTEPARNSSNILQINMESL